MERLPPLYCATIDGNFWQGSKVSIIREALRMEIVEPNRLITYYWPSDLNKSHPMTAYSYGKYDKNNGCQYNNEEAYIDASNFLFTQLSDMGFITFRQTDWKFR